MRVLAVAVIVAAAAVVACVALPHNLQPRSTEARLATSLLSQLGHALPANATRTQRILARLEELRVALKVQAEDNDKRAESALRELALECNTLDTTITDLHTQLEAAEHERGLVGDRLSQLNEQLFGVQQGGDATSEDALVNALHLDVHTDTPDSIPPTSEGSVLSVLKLVWGQLEAVEASCEADSAHHAHRGGERLDVAAINAILTNLTLASRDAEADMGCAFCNHTFCRALVGPCLVAAPQPGLPLEPAPDSAACWAAIDKYCSHLPGSRDPGCGCAASERCWDEVSSFGRCPLQAEDGSRDCDHLDQLQCKDFFAGDLAVLFGSPAHSAADEMFVQKLRDLRRRVVAHSEATAPPASDQPPHCAADIASLTAHFEKTEAVATTLWRRRSEVSLDLQSALVIVQAKREMMEAAEQTKQHLLTRIAQETQASVERREELAMTLRALDEVLGMVGDVGLARKAYERPFASRDSAVRSCQHLKRLQPSLPSGVYWVTLGKSADEAVRVYCDMVTDGGGWTLVWKNVGGAVSTTARLQHASNRDLLRAKDRADLVTPLGTDHKAQVAHAAYSYHAARENQEWTKWMGLYRGRDDEVTSQRVRLDMGAAPMAAVFAAADGCSALPATVRVYSTDPSSPRGATAYYLGETNAVVNRGGESFGLANSGTLQDMCLTNETAVPSLSAVCNANGGVRSGDVASPLVCDFQMLRRLGTSGNLTALGTWEIIRHVFSYSHSAPTAREASRCMYRCWQDHDDPLYNEVFVWGVRGKCPAPDGKECSGNGDCEDGVCLCRPGFEGPDCAQRVACAPLPSPGWGVRVQCEGRGVFGDVCSFACPDGYHVLGPATTRCNADRTWSGGVPSCAPVTCPVLPIPLDATLACSGNTHGDNCTLSCLTGFRLRGGRRAVCSNAGTWEWSGATPTCDRVVCERPDVPTSGSMSCTRPDFQFSTECRFTCAGEHVLRGSGTRVCGADGVFSGSPAVCEPLVCGLPSLGSFVTAKCSGLGSGTAFAKGDRCEFGCDSNYHLSGSASARCTASGEWKMETVEPPECRVIDECLHTVCAPTVPECERGKYVLSRDLWGACCFNPATDCAQFHEYVTMAVLLTADFSTSPQGTHNINELKRAMAEVAGVMTDDVGLVYREASRDLSGYVLQVTVAPSSLANKQSDVRALLSALDKATSTPQLQTTLAAHGIATALTLLDGPVIATRVPTEEAVEGRFEDGDGRKGWVEGSAVVRRPLPPGLGVSQYVLFFGDGNGVAQSNRIGVAVARGVVRPADNNPELTLTVPATKVPSLAKEWLVFSSSPFADAPTALAFPLADLERSGTNLTSGVIEFRDQDVREGWVRGNFTLRLSTVPRDATSFRLYFGNGGTTAESKVGGQAIAEGVAGEHGAVFEVAEAVAVPEGATHFLVFGRNVDVEGQKGVTTAFAHPPAPNHQP